MSSLLRFFSWYWSKNVRHRWWVMICERRIMFSGQKQIASFHGTYIFLHSFFGGILVRKFVMICKLWFLFLRDIGPKKCQTQTICNDVLCMKKEIVFLHSFHAISFLDFFFSVWWDEKSQTQMIPNDLQVEI